MKSKHNTESANGMARVDIGQNVSYCGALTTQSGTQTSTNTEVVIAGRHLGG